MTTIEARTPAVHELGEGARWVAGRLVYVDLLAGRLLELAPGAREPRELLRLEVPLGAVAPVADRPGQWIATAGDGIALLAADGPPRWLARPERDSPVPTRMNDGVCDPQGRFWAASMPYDGRPGPGSLYRTDPDGSVHRVLTGLGIVNGPAVTADGGLLYLADSAAGRILRFTVTPDGGLADRTLFAQLPPGHEPDGMTVDREGCLWSAVWGGSAVHRYAPDGALREVLAVPVRQPTSVCLHPTDGRLFVTSARLGLTAPTGPAGAVLTVAVSATAPAARAFRLD
ncbi:SMP-30/gluconolactonase/LRE family protein [Kitasatospora viridis]|uniref:Sugar lactone lactonase YvrE n=1 Tax=Kitasatospora viridis TaxID=281105 RepID=A0A561TTV4_9ACTN|nr:SMP-30/gluconolactonase/LRE family protein [Kitasatospora viridis]TWF90517.1 sugar lactone lactonase YvrE [Kitasatospora viridis]